jgi:hypothetical protein
VSRYGDALDDALDAHGPDSGTVRVDAGGVTHELEVEAVGPLGVRLRRLTVRRHTDRDLEVAARTLPERLRPLPERLVSTEVDPRLGGATLRTCPDEMRRREFFQVDVRPREAEIRRYRVCEGGRERVPWTMTRDGLREVMEDLAGEPG